MFGSCFRKLAVIFVSDLFLKIVPFTSVIVCLTIVQNAYTSANKTTIVLIETYLFFFSPAFFLFYLFYLFFIFHGAGETDVYVLTNCVASIVLMLKLFTNVKRGC